MKTLPAFLLLLIAITPSYIRGAELAPDPFLGQWVLDAKASHYPGRTCPKAMTIQMAQEARGIHYHSHTEPLVGDAFDVDYTASYDGKPAMVSGTRGILLPVTLHRTGETVTATYRNAFQVAATSQRVLSDAGRTMTITTMSYDSAGTAVTNVGVYRKVIVSPAPRTE